MADASNTDVPFTLLKVSSLVATPSTWNSRVRPENAKETAELLESTRADLKRAPNDRRIPPILVRPLAKDDPRRKGPSGEKLPAEYEIVFGNRRAGAVSAATDGKGEIRAKIEVLSDQEAMLANLQENLARRDVHPAETMFSVVTLVNEGGFDRKAVALKLGISPSTVDQYMSNSKHQSFERYKQDLAHGKKVPPVGFLQSIRSQKNWETLYKIKLQSSESRDLHTGEAGGKPKKEGDGKKVSRWTKLTAECKAILRDNEKGNKKAGVEPDFLSEEDTIKIGAYVQIFRWLDGKQDAVNPLDLIRDEYYPAEEEEEEEGDE